MPVFNDAPGIEALQLMVDMYRNGSTDPGSISYIGINDATNVLTAGNASMMMNWPFMWKPAKIPQTSKIVGKLGTAILPAGQRAPPPSTAPTPGRSPRPRPIRSWR